MAQTSSKIAPFPGCLDKRPAPIESGGTGANSDPTKELRAYIESLQGEARTARLHQEAAEEDRDRLAEEIRRLQLELDAANEARKEVRSVIVERDELRASLEKSEVVLVETRRRAEAADRQRTQVESQRDQAMALFKETRKEADQHLAARDEAVRQRDAALRHRAQVMRDQEEAVSRLAEAQRQVAELQRSLVEAQAGASKSDVDIQKQLLSIRQARDSAAAQAAELKNRIGELEDTAAELAYDREAAEKTARQALADAEALRAKAEEDADKLVTLETLQGELAEVGQELTALRQQHAGLQGAKDQLVAQLREFRETHETMLISNTSQIESTTKERDVLRARLQEREKELEDVRAELASTWASAMQVTEPEIERLSKELDSMRSRAAEIDAVILKSEEMAREREAMRLQVIELTAQLENSRREIKEIGAQLAEARLQLKLSARGVAIAAPARPAPAPSPSPAEGPAQPKDRMNAIRTAWNGWQRAAEDPTAAWEFAREAAAFAGSCQAAGQKTAHRVAAKLAAIAEVHLASFGTPLHQDLVEEAIDLLGRLHDAPGVDQSTIVTGKRIYLVEADEASCAENSDTLRAAGFSVEATASPSSAIADLSARGFDLILLEANLPELDGFELRECIRGMQQHASTPLVLMVDGAPQPERAPDAAFLCKPCQPAELALRVLLEVLKPQLELA